MRLERGLATVEIAYEGVPFPIEGELTGLELPQAHAKRGRGLFIVSELTQRLRFERTPAGNRWTFVAPIREQEDA